MNSKSVTCPSCQSRLKLPETIAAGKKVKCPKCSEIVTVPAGSADASYDVAADAPGETKNLSPALKSCPFCGEQVLANAVKCRHCGEFFEEKIPVERARARAAATGEMNPAEYVVATLFCPVGLIVGIIWKLKHVRKANDMLKVSALCNVIALAAVLVVYMYFIRETVSPLDVSRFDFPASGIPEGHVPAPEYEVPEFVDAAGNDMPPDLSDLERQPEEIRRAMKANVRISQPGGIGSGVIVRRDGGNCLILTNRHVVDIAFAQTGGALQVAMSRLPKPTIKFVTGEDREGKVVWLASDEVDLALVEASCPEGVEFVRWQETSEVTLGEQVFAVGNPAGLGWTYTRGVVSALRDRDYGGRKVPVIQTDTRIGPGNSGGGLYNQRGELIGINTFVFSSSAADAGETGLGFAIRKAVVAELKPDLLQVPAPPTP